MAIDKDPNQLWLADLERTAANLCALGERLRAEGVISDDDALVITTANTIMLSSTEQLLEFRGLMEENERLKEENSTDALTGAKNKHGFHESLREKLKAIQTRNFKGHVGLAYIDLDGFKSVNDRFGHDRGDDILKDVIIRLKDTFRSTDSVVCRPGGDEIILILPYEHGGQFSPQIIKDKVSESLEGLYVWDSEASLPYPIGASVGVSSTDDLKTHPPSDSPSDVYTLDDEEKIKRMTAEADRRMYENKWHNGEYTEENKNDTIHPKNQRLEVLRQEARDDYYSQNQELPINILADPDPS